MVCFPIQLMHKRYKSCSVVLITSGTAWYEGLYARVANEWELLLFGRPG